MAHIVNNGLSCPFTAALRAHLIGHGLGVLLVDGVSDQFIAYLVDGQGNPYGGQTVNFNIHGVFYERVTDSDGRAILNIRLGAASDVYIITSEYNGCRITNTITIVP